MIIQCSECLTRFNLADEKVKPGGIKVRCAKCKHVFPVSLPGNLPEPEVAGVSPASQGRGDIGFDDFGMGFKSEEENSVVAPEPESMMHTVPFKMESDSEVPLSGVAETDDPFRFEEEASAAEEKGTGLEASDWEVAEEPSLEIEEPAGETPEIELQLEGQDAREEDFDAAVFGAGGTSIGEDDFSLDETGEEKDFAFPPEGIADIEEEAGFAFEDEGDGPAGPSAFESEEGLGAFLLEEEIDGEEESGFTFEDEGESPAGSSDLDSEEGMGAFLLGEEIDEEELADFSWDAEPSEKGDLLTESDDMGGFSPEEESREATAFDLSEMAFGEEERGIEPASSEKELDTLSRNLGSEAMASPSPRRGVAPSEKPGAEAPPLAPMPLPKKRKSAFSGLTLFLLLLLLVLAGAAGYFYWSQGSLDQIISRIAGETPPVEQAGQIRLAELNSFFVNNARDGQLFAITGRAVNNFPQARSAITVKGVLFDKQGKPLMQQTVFCGNPLTEEVLKSRPFAQLEEAMNNQFGDSLSNLNVGSGKEIPFTIVFKNLPPNLSEFIVEVVDSKPASK